MVPVPRRRAGVARALALAAALVVVVGACGASQDGGGRSDLPSRVDPAPLPQPLVGGTGSVDGAHRVPGAGDLGAATVVDVPLEAPPAWVVAGATEDATWWLVADVDGGLQGVRVPDADPAAWVRVPVAPDALPPGAPPVLETVNPLRLVVPAADASPQSPPVELLPQGRAAVLADGSVRLGDGPGAPVLAVGAPPDARLAVDPVTGALAIPAGATDAYPHGAVGDELEASAVVVVGVDGAVTRLDLDDGEVLEGLGPAWVDLALDGEPELLLAASRAGTGTRVVALGTDGSRWEGPPTGRSNRWIHVLGASFLGPEREVEIAAVRTPHLGGVVEWYRPVDGRLEVVASLEGYRSHTFGSRNLDQVVLTDGTGDRRPDVIVPTLDQTALAVLTRTPRGAAEVLRLELPGPLATNIAAVGRAERPVAVGAATASGLRLWLAAPAATAAGSGAGSAVPGDEG